MTARRAVRLCGIATNALLSFCHRFLFYCCCGCRAHAAASVLGDRIKIARGSSYGGGKTGSTPALSSSSSSSSSNTAEEINLSVQFLLNCGSEVAGSCHGGSSTGAFEFIHAHSKFIPYDTCQPYVACSSDSDEGFCPYVNTTCTLANVCRSCMPGVGCTAVTKFPNATVAEYGMYRREDFERASDGGDIDNNKDDVDIVFAIMAEIWMRGPVKASVDATMLVNYTGGVIWDEPKYHSDHHNHGISIVGWSYDPETSKQYWIVRNSWGTYWGEMGASIKSIRMVQQARA